MCREANVAVYEIFAFPFRSYVHNHVLRSHILKTGHHKEIKYMFKYVNQTQSIFKRLDKIALTQDTLMQ